MSALGMHRPETHPQGPSPLKTLQGPPQVRKQAPSLPYSPSSPPSHLLSAAPIAYPQAFVTMLPPRPFSQKPLHRGWGWRSWLPREQ